MSSGQPAESVITIDFDVPPAVKPLLSELQDVFEEPTSLLPHRVYGHVIPL
jgi:hypothetical protein